MSEISTQGQAPVAPANGTGETATQDNNGSSSQGSGENSGYSSFVGELLKGAPQEHLPVLEPYLKKFDAGVTRRFQELSSKYKPYEELGADPQTLTQAYQIYQLLENNPKQLYDLLREDFEEGNTESQNPGDPQSPGIPQEWEQRFNKQQEILEALVDHVMKDRQSSTEQQEDQELEQYLGLLKQEYGEFDEDYVLAKMYAGAEPEAAIQAWNQLQQSVVNSAARPTPPVLSGGGSVPTESQSVKDLTKKDTVSMVASLLSQANQER